MLSFVVEDVFLGSAVPFSRHQFRLLNAQNAVYVVQRKKERKEKRNTNIEPKE